MRLQAASPCINAGNNGSAASGIHLDGNPRIAKGTVDIGAYEDQGPGSVISYAWLQDYGLPTDGSADDTDGDHDGMENWQEWVAGTDPIDAASALRLLSLVIAPPGVRLQWWSSVTNHVCFIDRAIGLGTTPAFNLLTNLPGRDATMTFTDTTAPLDGTAFYRVGTDSTGGVPIPWLQMPEVLPAYVTVTWTSVTNRGYVVERSAGRSAPMLFAPVVTNVPGQAGTTSFTDTNASGGGPFFYRVGIQQ